MRSGWRIAALGFTLALLEGCSHRQPKAAPPPAAVAPSVPPAQMARLIPPMPNLPPAAEQRPIMLDTTVPPPQALNTAPHPHHARRRAHPGSEETAQDAKAAAPGTPAPNPPANTQIASGGQPPDMSPIGELSTGTPDANTADRQLLQNQITSTENSLNGIHRSLSDEEQKTAALIRTFISKARQALKTDDLDGAKNYSTKAKILLDELTKQ